MTRNEDIDVEEDDAENLLNAMEKELLRRRSRIRCRSLSRIRLQLFGHLIHRDDAGNDVK